MGPPGGPSDEDGPSAAAVTAIIAAQPGPRAPYGIAELPATIAGVTGPVDLIGYTADPTWTGFELTEGRWFPTTGEAVAPTPLLKAVGVHIGDTVTVTVDGHLVPLRIVGEVSSTKNDGLQLFTAFSTLTVAALGVLRWAWCRARPSRSCSPLVSSLDSLAGRSAFRPGSRCTASWCPPWAPARAHASRRRSSTSPTPARHPRRVGTLPRTP